VAVDGVFLKLLLLACSFGFWGLFFGITILAYSNLKHHIPG
jgi:hypothetical protein